VGEVDWEGVMEVPIQLENQLEKKVEEVVGN